MVDYALATNQIRRLSGLRGYPRNGVAEGELIRALQAASLSDQHARTIVDDFVQGSDDCPKPKHFYELRGERKTGSRGKYCTLCGGSSDSGFERTILWWYLVTFRNGKEVSRERMPLDPSEIVMDGEQIGPSSDLFGEAVKAASRRFKDRWFEDIQKQQGIEPQFVRGRLGQAWFEVQEPCPRCRPMEAKHRTAQQVSFGGDAA